MTLTEHDKRSTLWLKLEAHLNERVEMYRKQNDGNLSPEETIRVRGRIAQLKEILALNEPMQAGATDNAVLTSGQILAGFSQE